MAGYRLAIPAVDSSEGREEREGTSRRGIVEAYVAVIKLQRLSKVVQVSGMPWLLMCKECEFMTACDRHYWLIMTYFMLTQNYTQRKCIISIAR
jgi:hypothetical protein